MFVLLCSFTKKKAGSVFPDFCHTTFHHALIGYLRYPEKGTIAQMYHDRDTYDSSQGHVTKNKPIMAVPVLVE